MLSVGVFVKRLHPHAILPTYANPGDAGADLYADTANTYLLAPGERKLFPTGIALEIPHGFVGLVHPRSGLAHSSGVTVVNAPGTVDSSYRGEIFVNLINLSNEYASIAPQSRIAQLVIQEVWVGQFIEVDELTGSERGEGGHGSTGV